MKAKTAKKIETRFLERLGGVPVKTVDMDFFELSKKMGKRKNIQLGNEGS